jgi:hypothetical protein
MWAGEGGGGLKKNQKPKKGLKKEFKTFRPFRILELVPFSDLAG